MRNISTTATEAINSPETTEVFLVLLEIAHTSLPSPIRVVNNKQDITVLGEVFSASAFKFILPPQDDGVIGNSQLSIDNVDRRIVEAIRGIDSFPDVTATIVLASDPDFVEAGPWDFQLRNVTYNRQTVSGELIYENYLRDNCGTIRYRNLAFPGLFG